jgi:diadenosine tetraphosphatase ApaH/serine/threonine PP2A family protein phosphatase
MAGPKRLLIVGDVHGCVDELDTLLETVRWQKDESLVLAGDLVAKGPASREVLQRAIEWKARAVLGNHDAHVLRWRQTPPSARKALAMGAEHLRVAESLGESHWRYLESLPPYLRFPEVNTVVVHAGLLPQVALESQPREWLLNLRSLRPDGSPSKKVNEGVPWASLWHGPERVVFGHDAVRKLQQYPHALGLDTGCVYGGLLSGYLLPEGRLVQVPARRAYR